MLTKLAIMNGNLIPGETKATWFHGALNTAKSLLFMSLLKPKMEAFVLYIIGHNTVRVKLRAATYCTALALEQ